jgi:broad specificity phosphatase PhoE
MAELLVIRHGQTEGNADCDGICATPHFADQTSAKLITYS